MALKNIQLPESVVKLQRFIRGLSLLEPDDESEIPLDEEKWNQIRNNWSTVQNGIIGLAETIIQADEMIEEQRSGMATHEG